MRSIGNCPFCGFRGWVVEVEPGKHAVRFDLDHDSECPLRDARTRTYETADRAGLAWSMRCLEETPAPRAMDEDEAEDVVSAYERIQDYDQGAADVIRDVIIKAMTGR